MSHLIKSIVIALLVADLLVACAAPTPTSILVPEAASTVLPTAPAVEALSYQTFTSQRFGYSIEVPEGWLISEPAGEWAIYKSVDPRNGIGIDTFKAYIDGKNLAFAVGARPLTDGSVLEVWKETVKETIRLAPAEAPCFRGQAGKPASEAQITLAGEPAILLEYLCPEKIDSFGIIVVTVYKGQGYWISWVSPQGSEAEFRAQFAEILNTFSFKSQ